MKTVINDNIKKIFLPLIFENIMHEKPQTLDKYISVIANSILKQEVSEEGFSEFITNPEWDEIRIRLIDNSFRYNLAKFEFPELDYKFNELVQNSMEFYYAMNDRVSKDIQYGKLCLNYLQSYRDMMIAMNQYEMLNDDLCYTSNLLQSLTTGFDWSEKQLPKGKKVRFLGFYSPETWEKLCVFFKFLINHPLYNSPTDGGTISKVFYDIIKEKFLHMFFEDIIISGERYIETYYNVGFSSLVNRNDLSSVEPIRPVRLVDKIRAYIENCEELGINLPVKDGKYEIDIAIIGYVKIDTSDGKSEELEMLCSTLELLYSDYNYVFNFTIYVNENDPYFFNIKKSDTSVKIETKSDIINMSLEKCDYLTLFSPREFDYTLPTICRVINQNKITLILDTPNLYTRDYYLLRNSSKDFPGRDAYDNYVIDYNRLNFKGSKILVSGYKYAPIHILTSKINMLALNEDSYDDTLKYKLNTPIIDYLRRYVESREFNDVPRDVHIFISSKTSVRYSQYARKNFTRVERYNGKNFNLITLRSNTRKVTVNTYTRNAKKNYMVFSFWNFIKNIDYHILDKGGLFEYPDEKNFRQICADSMGIYIKMEWENSLEMFKFSIDYDDDSQLTRDKKNKGLLRDLMNDIFKIIFSSNDDLFSECLRHAFSNTIYSQMEYLDDAVFYCIFCGKFPGKFEPNFNIEFESFSERPVMSVNQPIFWTVVKTIESLGAESLFSDQLLETRIEFRDNIENYKFENNADSFEAILQSIMSICELYGYTDSCLYRNVLKTLS